MFQDNDDFSFMPVAPPTCHFDEKSHPSDPARQPQKPIAPVDQALVLNVKNDLFKLIHQFDSLDIAEDLFLQAEGALKTAIFLRRHGDLLGALEAEKIFLAICSTGQRESSDDEEKVEKRDDNRRMRRANSHGPKTRDKNSTRPASIQRSQTQPTPSTTSSRTAPMSPQSAPRARPLSPTTPTSPKSSKRAARNSWSFFTPHKQANNSPLVEQILSDEVLLSKLQSEVQKSGVVTASGYQAVFHKFLMSEEVSNRLNTCDKRNKDANGNTLLSRRGSDGWVSSQPRHLMEKLSEITESSSSLVRKSFSHGSNECEAKDRVVNIAPRRVSIKGNPLVCPQGFTNPLQELKEDCFEER